MTESVMISLEGPVLRGVDAMAHQLGVTRATFVQSVVDQLVTDGSEQASLIQAGIDELDRGEVVTQGDMDALSARYRAVS